MAAASVLSHECRQFVADALGSDRLALPDRDELADRNNPLARSTGRVSNHLGRVRIQWM
jgi:hypothetical protein